MHNCFQLKPWHHDQSAVSDRPWGMLFSHEAAMLYYVARDEFSSLGEIIDAGAFLGASSYCLAKGLEENPQVIFKLGRIHAFDLFEPWSEIGSSRESNLQMLRKNFNVQLDAEGSFVNHYKTNLGKLLRYVQIHRGDILASRWPGHQIEILFVDVCKQLAIMRHVADTFYRSLIPGVSLVIHQDYHHPLLPFIPICHERLADYFEVVEEIADTSIVFRLREPIPGQVLDEVATYPYSPVEQVRLIDQAIDRLSEQIHLRLAKAVLLHRLGRTGEARSILNEAVRKHDPTVLGGVLKMNLQACRWAMGL